MKGMLGKWDRKGPVAACMLLAAVLVGVAMMLMVSAAPSVSANGAPQEGILRPDQKAYGRTLGHWLDEYWRWSFTAADTSQPARVGPMTLMPLPVGEQIGGDWTPEDPAYLLGTINVTLEEGSTFVLPCVAWTLEIYCDGSRDEPFPYWPLSEFQTYVTDMEITLDHEVILDPENFWDYYVERVLDPPVVYREPSPYCSVAAWAYQGVGFVAAPLPVGQHKITLYEKWVVAGWFGLIYDNTWKITVVPKGGK